MRQTGLTHCLLAWASPVRVTDQDGEPVSEPHYVAVVAIDWSFRAPQASRAPAAGRCGGSSCARADLAGRCGRDRRQVGEDGRAGQLGTREATFSRPMLSAGLSFESTGTDRAGGAQGSITLNCIDSHGTPESRVPSTC